MTTTPRLASRVLRRELHSPRSGLAILLAALAVVALAWVGTESVLAAVGRPALLMDPSRMAAGIRGLPSVPSGTLVVTGVVLALIGLVLVVAAVLPGRRGRHVVAGADTPTVVDDAVIASSLVRTAANAAGLSPDRAVASVGKRSAVVRLVPVSGVPVDTAAVQRAVDEQAESFGLQPTIRPRIVVDKNGKVGG
jgi:hypothetical protein